MAISLKSLTSRLSDWFHLRKESMVYDRPWVIATSVLEERLVKLEIEVAQMKRDRLKRDRLKRDRLQILENSSPRKPGQDQGKVWISDDFNAPLPEALLNDFLNPL